MDLKQLRSFVRIVDLGGFSKAAEALHIAQPALSQQIANLENELGIKLLVRISSGARPTEPGKTLYRYAQAIQKQVDQVTLELREHSFSPAGLVAIGLPHSVATVLGIPLLKACRAAYPKVVIQILENANNFLSEMLANGRLDIAFLYGALPSKSVVARQRLVEELFLVSPFQQGEHQGDEIKLEELSRYNLILPSRDTPLRSILEHARPSASRHFSIVAEIHSLPTLRAAVLEGLGSTVLPWSAVAQEIAANLVSVSRIVDPDIKRPLAVCVSDTLELSDAASRVLRTLELIIPGLLADGSWRGVSLSR